LVRKFFDSVVRHTASAEASWTCDEIRVHGGTTR